MNPPQQQQQQQQSVLPIRSSSNNGDDPFPDLNSNSVPVRQTSNLALQTNNLVQQTSNLFHPNSNLVQQSSNLVQQSSNLVQQNLNVPQQNPKFVQPSSNFNQQNSDTNSNFNPDPLNSNSFPQNPANSFQQVGNTLNPVPPNSNSFQQNGNNLKSFQDSDSAFIPPSLVPDSEFDTGNSNFKVVTASFPGEFSSPLFRAPRFLQYGFRPITPTVDVSGQPTLTSDASTPSPFMSRSPASQVMFLKIQNYILSIPYSTFLGIR